MKVKVLSLLVPALLVAGAANAAEIYNKDGNKLDLFGKVDGLHYFSDDKSADGDQTYMRIGFKGETQVNDQITGYGQWEYQIQGNAPESENNSWTRVAFAGLKFGDAGSFDYGRNYGVVYDVTSWTDVLPEFGGDTYGSDNFMQQRGNGFATYRNADFFGLVDGLNFALQYQGKNGSPSGEGADGLAYTGVTNNGREALRQNGDGVGGSVTYDIGEGFGLGAAVSSSKRTDEQNKAAYLGNGDRAETYTGGLKYDANNVYLAAQYTQTYNATRVGGEGWANKAQNFEVVAQYQFDFGLRPSVAYLQSKGKNLGTLNGRNYDDEDLLKYVDVGATYYFNKNMSTYVDYKINLLDDNSFTRDAGISTDDIVALGLVYQF
ncbi:MULTISPECIES: porin OmpC [Citrobacter]|jgi:outer membrane pore protein C|uniref:porin OmpC n=1 Tax=Citrobacter TaxID=544 RepID=UPI00076AEDD6|nr:MULTISPECIES: porin OmpC [Citrobacter]AMG91190.1 porin OmpC [Citrobacter amalonaticus]AUO63635.1 porin OmpC [Citrobacter freundii complex sp. CFNIH2]ELK6623269.1 porin OmpC [Citrobacter amalonaticus]MBJ9256078.1 porin OmpC [Citrobacter amalonaticus]MBJ9275022.1 porin OmpC [Citrobacter amalonaticus]